VSAGFRAAVAVQTEQETAFVHVVGEGRHAAREALAIAHESTRAVSAVVVHPLVVEIEVHVACVAQARAHHDVGDPSNLLFVDVLVECVPAVPAHGRRESDAVFLAGTGVPRRVALLGSAAAVSRLAFAATPSARVDCAATVARVPSARHRSAGIG
jgi:hypothetical protein